MTKYVKEKMLINHTSPSTKPKSTLPSHLKAIHQDALQKAKNYRRAEYELLEVIEKVERLKVFRRRGFNSLYEYVIKDLGLSEALTYHFIKVARKMREVPALGDSIQKNEISVSKAKKVASVLTQTNQKKWLEKAKQLSSRQLEKEVARENPKLAVPEKASYVSAKRIQLQVGVDERLMLQLRRVQDLESQRLQRPASLEETLQAMASLYLEKKDPQEKAKRSIARGSQRKISQQNESKESQHSQVTRDSQPLKDSQTTRTSQTLEASKISKTSTTQLVPLVSQVSVQHPEGSTQKTIGGDSAQGANTR